VYTGHVLSWRINLVSTPDKETRNLFVLLSDSDLLPDNPFKVAYPTPLSGKLLASYV